jgi:surface protein
MFYNCSSLTELDVSGFNTVSAKRMRYMFAGCSSLTSLDLSSFNTTAVTDMYAMFNSCSCLTSLDVSGFNTVAVTDMGFMFAGCSSLSSLDLSNYNTATVTSMCSMFDGCSSLTCLDVSSFNTAAVSNMINMFRNCSSLTILDVGSFITTATSYMAGMFSGCSSLISLDISNFDVSSETTIDFLFRGCNKLSSINIRNNDFSTNDATNTVFEGVGSPSAPCNLIIDSGFDKSVLGDYNGSYYYWRGGYFIEPIKCECVDLGLPSGTLWATFNVGARSPEEYGDYYRFGELETRDYYSIDNYNDDYLSKLTPIFFRPDSYLASLKDEYDVANVKWGNCWNMPSMKQIEELFCYCTAESEILNGVLCTKMTGPNGNSIIFPLNGYYNGDAIQKRATLGSYQCGETIVSLEDKSMSCFLALAVFEDRVIYDVMEQAIPGLGVRPIQRPKQEILPISATIDKDSVQMQIGETITLTGTIYPENATYKYGIWSTYDDKIVSIDKYTGKVTAKASGSAKVYFSDSFGYLFEAVCTIIVK